MTIWLPKIAGRAGPKYLVIADSIAESIADGTLSDGDRLPPQRELAEGLGVSLNTVTRAYGECKRRGLLEGEVGRGTYVRAGGPLRTENIPLWFVARPTGGMIDFTMNLPAIGDGAARLADALAQLSRSADLTSYLDCRPPGSIDANAQAGAAWIGKLGFEIPGEEVVLTAGAQHGVLVSLMGTTRPGDALLTESLTYPPLKQLAHHLDLKLYPVTMDEHGLLPEALDTLCRKTTAKVLYCMPTLHSPTTATMPVERRREIASIARRYDLTLIEDDVFGFLPEERPPPLAAFAPERSLFITSVSKTLGPGLRVGYLRAPNAHLGAVRTAVHMTCWIPPPLMAEIARRWISDGTAESLRSWQRSEAQARQRIAARVLGRFPYRSDPSGLHLWLGLPKPWRGDTFRMEAEGRGVKVLTGEIFAVEQTPAPHAIRVCLGRVANRERMTAGLEILAGLLAGKEGSGLSVV